MKDNFSRWYADEIKTHVALDKGTSLDKVKIDLKASLIKPLHGNWLITTITTLQSQTASLVTGFETVGITECFQ